MSEKIPRPEDEIKSPTAMELAFPEAEEAKQLIQVETKYGLATEWQNDEVPLGRVMPRVGPADIEPLVQVETAPDGQADDIGDKTSPYYEIEELDNQYPDHLAPSHVRKEYFDLDAAVKESIASGDEGTQRIAMGRLDAFMTEQREGVRSEDTIDLEQKEGTPKEWRDKLRETVAWWASPSERLIRRNAELDADLDKIGGTERRFRNLGEWYNKRKWYTKLAVGAGLGLGAAFSAGVSFPIALSCVSGIAAQRIAGLSTMYLKFEKKSHEEAWGKEKAFLKAAVYTAVMGLAIKEGIEYVSETESAHVVQKWLGEALGHFSLSGATHAPEHAAEVQNVPASAPEVAAQPMATASAPEIAPPAAAAAAGGEVAAPAIAPEISGIEVTATPGHGYEYMMKRLWEDLHEKGIKLPPGANPDSDLARLLGVEKGDAAGINKLVHTLAEENEWFKENGGTNAVIGEHAKMTIDTHGDIWIDHKDIIAPESASVTPAYHAGAEAPHVSEVTEGKNLNIDDGTRQSAQEFVAPLKSATPLSETLTDAGSSGTIPDAQVASASSSEVSLAPVHEHSVINSSGFEISTTQPHLYTGKGDSIIAFGGQKADRLKEMLNYLKSNPDKTIIAADSSEKLRAVWSLVEGKLEQGALIEKPSFFGFLIPDTSPSPDDLGKIIK